MMKLWFHARVRLMPGLLSRSPPRVRAVFDNPWAPMNALAQQLSCMPPALWGYLLSCSGGFVEIIVGDSRYVPGPARIRRREVLNIAYVSVGDLAQDNERPLHVVGHLIDHHLGCGGDDDGCWLSEGGGVTPAWQEAGTRIARLFSLEYGIDDVARSSPRDYFAQSLAVYCRDRQRLNVADPQFCKWLRSVLWNSASWKTKR